MYFLNGIVLDFMIDMECLMECFVFCVNLATILTNIAALKENLIAVLQNS